MDIDVMDSRLELTVTNQLEIAQELGLSAIGMVGAALQNLGLFEDFIRLYRDEVD